MRHHLSLMVVLLAFAATAEGQVTYCKDIGNNKTYCSGGTVIHRQGRTTIISNPMPAQPPPSATLPNPLLQNNALPTMTAPYSAAGTQDTLPVLPAPVIQPARPDAPGSPVIIVPPSGGGRVCHQFGTTLVCN